MASDGGHPATFVRFDTALMSTGHARESSRGTYRHSTRHPSGVVWSIVKERSIMPYLENHLLYYKKSCPYCQKVLRFMDDNKINMNTRDTLQPGNQNDLVRIGGKKQVPCLVVNGKPMYESDDIVEYLRDYA